ncbi:S8 family serine peptidase [Lentzea tibetensis]|uniref:S8 family serine peptidase n=1 Tax=Lentzea tibetensis TaxID=2591470 RepID=A0A563EJT6_9PSEU|nr:S8 family serine peptidase [Lentzea tibetensis]TWP47281.1 S8 family serine peptidase [Lentzea tibetensis]
MRLLPFLLLLPLPAVSPTDSPAPPAPPPQTAAAVHHVTLITGDVVRYAEEGDGKRSVQVEPAPRADQPPPVFQTFTDDDGLHVVPSDAVPLVASGKVSRALFNVTALVRQGLADEETSTLPVLVTSDGPMALSAADQHTRVASIGASGVRVHKADAERFWESLGAAKKVLLDKPVKVSLDRSVKQIGAPAAWQAGLDGAGTTVAVVDTGIDADHPAVAGKVVAAENFTDEPDVADLHGHGTHVASIVTGVAPGAKLVVAKVFDASGEGETSRIMAGIEWASTHGAKIVNLSMGGEPTDGSDELSALVDDLSARTGVLFVVAAGNNGPGPRTVTTPGAATKALTVGAVDRENRITDFSSRGPRLGDAAVKPEIVAPGAGIVAARAAGTSMGAPVDDLRTAASGTSMATPHVSGAAALLAQQHPSWTGEALKSALVSSAKDAGLRWHEQGSGVLDVARAVSRPAYATLNGQELVYHNDSDAPLSLDLHTSFQGWDGRAAALQTSSSHLVVPAHGKTSTTLSADLTAAGAYGGVVTASGDFRTPVSMYLAPERFSVHVHVKDSSGKPVPATLGQLIDDSGGRDNTNDPFDLDVNFAFDVVDGEGSVDVPGGTYSAMTWSKEPRLDGRRWTGLSAPELKVDGERDLTLDARQAVPVGVTAPVPVDQRDRTIMLRRVVPGHIDEAGLVLGATTWQPYVTPVPAAKQGAISLQDTATLHRKAVDMGPLHPEYDAGTLAAKLPGKRTLPVVTGGDITGKAVLVRIPAPTGPGDPTTAVFKAATQAAAANAKAALVIAYVDSPGAVPISGLSSATVPTVSISRAEADKVGAEVTIDVRPQPDEVFNLSFLDPNGIPADHVRTINRDDLVRVNTSYHAEKPGLSVQKTWYPFPTGLWQTQFLSGVTFPVPARWTEYVGPADARMVWKRVVTLNGTDEKGGRAAMSMYQQNVYKPGERTRPDETWFAAPIHNGAVSLQPDHPARYPDGEVWRQLCNPCRVGDVLVPPLNWGDGTPGHFTNPYENGKHKVATTTKLFKGDQEIPPDSANPFAPFPTFPLEPAPATYRLTTTDTHSPTAQYGAPSAALFRLAGKVDTSWTFTSSPSTTKPPKGFTCYQQAQSCAQQPLIQLHHRFPLSLTNTAPPGADYTFTIDATSTRPITRLTLSYSTDGKTWLPATTSPANNTWKVTLKNPATGMVSLRTEARDASGNTVTQTMQNAYAVS